VSRAHSIAPLFEAGMIYAPDEQWAHELIEECAAFPNGEYDDYVDSCLVGESVVLMADGSSKRLDCVQVGDAVHTPDGPRSVVRFLDQGVKEVWEVLVGETSLLATADHLVMTGRGWVRVDKLVPCVDTVIQSNTGALTWGLMGRRELFGKRLFLTAGLIIDTLRAAIRRTGDILRERDIGFIGMFGSFTTALFPRATMSTTLTGTRPTTTYQTCPASLLGSIEGCTSPKFPKGLARQSIWPIWPRFEMRRLHGTSPRKEGHGIASTPNHLLPRHVGQKKNGVLLSWILSARGAVQRALATAPSGNFVARGVRARKVGFGAVRAVRNTRIMRRVYDLEVDDQHCFYANGLLVHNCTQALMRYRQGNFVQLPTDDWDADEGSVVQPRVYYG
jgi:hypothetical protein